MSIWISLVNLAWLLAVAFMAGVAWALWQDDDSGTFDEAAEIVDERRRAA